MRLRTISALALMTLGIAAPAAAADVTLNVAPDAITVTGDARPGPLAVSLTAAAGPTGVAIVELKAGHTVQELRGLDLAGLEDARPVEQVGRLVAGGTAAPGKPYRTTITARAATYVAVDVTHEPGPLAAFTVSGAADGAAPRPDARITIHDARFALPARLPAEGVLRIDNAGTRPHHVTAIRIPRAVSSADAVRFVRDGKLRKLGPATALVGLVSPGTRNDVDVQLQPGRYVLVSFYGVPGTKPDVLRGLIATARVR